MLVMDPKLRQSAQDCYKKASRLPVPSQGRCLTPTPTSYAEGKRTVAYHPGHVLYIVRDQLGWTWQRPARRAVERNDTAIERWVKQRWGPVETGVTSPPPRSEPDVHN